MNLNNFYVYRLNIFHLSGSENLFGAISLLLLSQYNNKYVQVYFFEYGFSYLIK